MHIKISQIIEKCQARAFFILKSNIFENVTVRKRNNFISRKEEKIFSSKLKAVYSIKF